ncbi:MAG: MEDS domain-containing protein, partial [Acetivibrionales bacterium]
EWYLKNGSFNEKDVNRRWDEICEYAVSNNYDGLRATGDASWLRKDEYHVFAQYEQSLAGSIPKKACIVTCMYDVNKVTFQDYTEILKNHGIVITMDKNEVKILKDVELFVRTRQLEQSRKDYKKLLRILPDTIFIHDSKAIYYCNEAAANIIGMDNICGIVGKSILDFIHIENRDAYCRFINKVIHKNTGTNLLECSLMKKMVQP